MGIELKHGRCSFRFRNGFNGGITDGVVAAENDGHPVRLVRQNVMNGPINVFMRFNDIRDVNLNIADIVQMVNDMLPRLRGISGNPPSARRIAPGAKQAPEWLIDDLESGTPIKAGPLIVCPAHASVTSPILVTWRSLKREPAFAETDTYPRAAPPLRQPSFRS